MEISLENLHVDIGVLRVKNTHYSSIDLLVLKYCTCIRVFTMISSCQTEKKSSLCSKVGGLCAPLKEPWGNPLRPALSDSSLYY